MLACVAATNGHPLSAFVYGHMMLLADLALVMQIRIRRHRQNTVMLSLQAGMMKQVRFLHAGRPVL
jgi:hypothetical protein